MDYLVDQVARCEASRGKIIFGPEDRHHFSYLVTHGLVRLECTGHRGEPLSIQIANRDRLFGLEWLPTTKRRAIRAVAMTDVTAGVITQDAIATAYDMMPRTGQLGVMSYAWRPMSALVVAKAEARDLRAGERLLHALWGLTSQFGQPTPAGVHLLIRLTIDDLAMITGSPTDTVKHSLGELLAAGRIARIGNHIELRGAPPNRAVGPDRLTPYRGVPAPGARGTLDNLLARCNHLGLNGNAMTVVSRLATLLEVPAGELLLPPGSEETVAFMVRGSAWLEGVGNWGRPFTLQLLPPGRFVRLPTGRSRDGLHLWGRAHRDCVVALLTLEQMGEVIEAMTVRGSLSLLDATCRDLSRHVCDLTTAPTRTLECRIYQAGLFLAHDFPGPADQGVSIKVQLTEAEIGRLVGVGHPAVARALAWLIEHGWVARVAPQRYVLLRLPDREQPASSPCPICTKRRSAPRRSAKCGPLLS